MIFYLAKIFSEREYADKFIRGEMYCQQLAWFKKLEDGVGRGDSDEGAIALKLDGLSMTFEVKHPVTGELILQHTLQGLAAPPVIRPEWFDHINVFCMFAAHSSGLSHELSDSDLDSLRVNLQIPERCTGLGEHAVVITNVTEFLSRVEKAAHGSGFGILWGMVNYYDPLVGSPVLDSEIETIFCKPQEYAYQSEFRFAIDTGRTTTGAITLGIGDIGDIAFRADTMGLRLKLNKLN